ncbi:SDR family NAD(P)-dependent oxidoreductase [Streptomyces noursei]|uniref:SDR family NAD(P)-dependent oxidoreductase n=1 Tax=Streptomyces noursei TaxID=1971 RepID=UPI00167607B6|nr:SDR family oxidoreductase [Streptomyces noursei]MCZ1015193.1 SDR family oxidoreductase [Streptomyces noursei]GGX03926.1 3-oxoacyl-ACP reductase [Streptomyces noursei]
MARTILITGGGTGIGRALAEHFAAHGDRVVITGRRPGPLKDAADALTGVTAEVCDHTDPAALHRLAAELPERLDVLVNNAGGQTDFDADGATDLASYARDFRANLDANLLSAALTTRAVDDRLAAGGAVIHIGSIAADQGSGSYGAAKAGLASWNVDLARTLGPRGITANVVSPGYIAGTEFFRDQLADARRERLIAATATGRPGALDDITGAVAFLASPAARHITGQVLNVNGGAHPTR